MKGYILTVVCLLSSPIICDAKVFFRAEFNLLPIVQPIKDVAQPSSPTSSVAPYELTNRQASIEPASPESPFDPIELASPAQTTTSRPDSPYPSYTESYLERDPPIDQDVSEGEWGSVLSPIDIFQNSSGFWYRNGTNEGFICAITPLGPPLVKPTPPSNRIL